MNANILIQLFFSGLTYGSIYAVAAIGFNIIYNATGIINFAQGEFVMLGGMLAFTLSRFLPLWAAILLAIVLTALIGSLLELVFIRSLGKITLYRLPAFRGRFSAASKPGVLHMIVVTIGMSIILREAALQIWGEQVKTLPFFTGNETSSISLLGAHFSPQILWVLGITALIVLALSLFFKYALTGQAMRGCADTAEGASLCGVSPRRVVNLAFALSAGIGALAGCVIAPLTQIQYAMGTELAIKGFTVAIFGGLGSSMGALSAGLLLGLLEAFAILFIPEAYKNIITIGILLLVLFFRPGGLLGARKSRKLKES